MNKNHALDCLDSSSQRLPFQAGKIAEKKSVGVYF